MGRCKAEQSQQYRSVPKDRRVLYQLPTGAGKTVIFCEIARQAVSKGKRVLVIVHRQELLRQTISKVSAACIPWGAIAPGYSMQLDWPLQIAMVQTAARRDIGSYDLIICDEAHHAVAGSWYSIIENQPQITDLFPEPTYDELEKALAEWMNPENADSDVEEEDTDEQ